MTFDDLKFVRLTTPELFGTIPPELFEQVRDSDFKIERLYQFGPATVASPLTFLYVLCEKEALKKGDAKAKGILWAEICPFTENLNIHILSIAKEYQGNGTLEKTLEFLEELKEKEGLNKLQIVTTRTKFYEEKQHWKRSNRIIMEK
jgi:hypothetical protein